MRLMRLLLCAGAIICWADSLAKYKGNDSVPDPVYRISRIQIIGNKTTRPWVVRRELSIMEGDSLNRLLLIKAMELSRRNLVNTSLFNSVDARYVLADSLNAEVYIVLEERWYLWPVPVFELAETNLNSWWQNKDFSRINYGLDIATTNFRGRNENLKFHVQFGFTELISVSYSTPYLNRRGTMGLGLYGGYGQNHEVNYNSEFNKRMFYKDVDRIQLQHSKAGAELYIRRKFFSNHAFGVGFDHIDIADSIRSLNRDYLAGSKREMDYLSAGYRFDFDRRDNKNYPLKGSYFSSSLTKFGLGILNPSLDLWWLKLEWKKYWPLNKRFYLAALGRSEVFQNERQPYYLRDGLGYSDKTTIRSYELYVIDGQQMAIGKVQLRYQLISPKSYELEFVPVNKFKKIYYSVYLGIFGDAGYAVDNYGYPSNSLANELQYGSGISLDLATYYDLVYRMEFSINKFGEYGLYFHFVAPI